MLVSGSVFFCAVVVFFAVVVFYVAVSVAGSVVFSSVVTEETADDTGVVCSTLSDELSLLHETRAAAIMVQPKSREKSLFIQSSLFLDTNKFRNFAVIADHCYFIALYIVCVDFVF